VEKTITFDGGTVTGITAGVPGGVGVLLAHGAGAGQHHPWMVAMRQGLAGRGLFVMSFDYRYMEAGKRAPDRLPMLLSVHRAAADVLAAECDRVVIAGKSMGGRVGSHLVGGEGWSAAAAVYFGYPLVPMGKNDPRPTNHLDAIEVPQLFFAGTRDRLSPPALIGPIADRVPDGTLAIVEDADHSFKMLKRSLRTDDEALADVAATAANWISERL
jgi:predicted alpha/beta-hydrolase family hydrolase